MVAEEHELAAGTKQPMRLADPGHRFTPDRRTVLADREVERAVWLGDRLRRCRVPIRCRRVRGDRSGAAPWPTGPRSCRWRTPTRPDAASTPTHNRSRTLVRSPSVHASHRRAEATLCSGSPILLAYGSRCPEATPMASEIRKVGEQCPCRVGGRRHCDVAP